MVVNVILVLRRGALKLDIHVIIRRVVVNVKLVFPDVQLMILSNSIMILNVMVGIVIREVDSSVTMNVELNIWKVDNIVSEKMMDII